MANIRPDDDFGLYPAAIPASRSNSRNHLHVIGLFWVIGGIIEFFSAYSDYGSDARGWRIGMGVLAFAAGVVTLVWPHLTLGVLAVIMGIWLIIYSLLLIALSFQLRTLAKA